MDNKIRDEFILERYKFILQEIHTLNENIYKYLTLFQTIATAVIAGGVGIFVSWRNLKIDAVTARVAIQGSVLLLIILTLFVIFSIIANVFSWLDYRKEEVELLDKAVKPDFRRPPSLGNFWRWSETYISFFIFIVVVLVIIYIEYIIIPLVK